MKLNLNPNKSQLALAALPSEKQASRAIKTFKTNDQVEFDFDPDDKEQIRTYMQLRQISMRVTAHQLATAIRGQKSHVSQGASMRFQYYGVPKANFPNGLPARLVDA